MKQNTCNGLILAEDARSLIWTRKEILAALVSQGIVLDVAVPQDSYGKQLEELGCNLIPISISRRGTNPIVDFGLMLQFRKILGRKKYDFAISYSIKPNIYGGFALRLAHVPFFLNITGMGTAMNNNGLLRSFVCFLYRFVSPYAAGVFFENQSNCNSFVNWKLCKLEQTQVFHGAGINLTEYPAAKYPQSSNEIRLLYIGRLMAEKGIVELCEAAKTLCSELPFVHFDIVGACDESFADYFNQHSGLPNMHWHGFQENVRPFIEKCHAILLPSYHEGMANALLEGGAMGRPLLTSRIPGCQEAVIHEKTGFLFPSRNVNEMLCAIRRFADLPHDCKILMGNASREHIAGTFDRKEHVTRISALIQTLLKKNNVSD